ncbi:unnamed protein product [Urochloa humidicola]
MRFLGELYNYEYIDSSVIFETLNLLIVFAHGTPEQDLLDPPEDCFRIRLIVTLLQTCGHYFSRGSSKRKLDRFLLFFQRYALRKGPLPLDVEFDVQDMFAELRPNMTRHSSIEGLNDALVELEENEHVMAVEKGGDERHSDNESQLKQSEHAAFDTNGKRAANEPKKNVKDHEEVADSESSSDSRSRYWSGHEDSEHSSYEERLDDRLENEDHSEGIDAPVDSDEEETVEVRHEVVRVDPEQEDFDRELKAILQERLESRKLELARPTVNMTIPMNAFEGSKDLMFTEAADKENVCGETGKPCDLDDVCVKVLVRRGHKQQTKQMLVPGDCPLVQSTKQQGAAELEEMQYIKQKILEYNEREEELEGGSLQGGDWGQGGSGNMPLAGSPGRISWVGPNRGGSVRRHYWVAGGFYRGYGR